MKPEMAMANIAGGDAPPPPRHSSEFGRIARNSSDYEQTIPSGLIRSSCDSKHDYKSIGARRISGLPLYPCSRLNELGSIPTQERHWACLNENTHRRLCSEALV